MPTMLSDHRNTGAHVFRQQVDVGGAIHEPERRIGMTQVVKPEIPAK